MKTESQPQKPRSATESGQFPKPDLSMFESRESKEPTDRTRQHEKPDPASITGVIPIVKFEREDSAKDQDDSAAGREK
jgi:hypothetical protein